MTQKTVVKPHKESIFDVGRLSEYIDRICSGFPHLDKERLLKSTLSKLRKDVVTAEEITRAVYMSAVELIDKGTDSEGKPDGTHPDYTFVAARAYLTKLYKSAGFHRGYKADRDNLYGSFLDLIKDLVDKDIYREDLLKAYSEEDIKELGKVIDPEKDKLFTYLGILTLDERYLTKDLEGNTQELPQERLMIVAMQLMVNEPKEKRIELVKEAYWALSNLYMTVATPTLSNSGKKRGGQLSSCFVDTVDDSLEGIYNSNTDVARLSKMGGGIGVYMGKVRSLGSSIRGHKGASSGVIPWIRQLNNTAVSVDQLGVRTGAITVYLDVWHKDIFDFLDLRLNNGDARRRATDIFTGICIPDLFMEKLMEVDENGRSVGKWYLFDPHEIRSVMGWSLEDFYDEEKGNGTFRKKYQELIDHPLISKTEVRAMDIMVRVMQSQLETGTPFMFYRDTVNRFNPNKHKGMIYCSNLCTEIAQNMSPTTIESETLETIDGEVKIVTVKKPGDFVVCNLSSINLARAVEDDVLERLINIEVRMLDNVIDINDIDVLQAKHSNKLYRSIGLGTFGLHHLLAKKRIEWGSEEAIEFNDILYEKINYYAIKASMELAKEKGAYPLFEGSDWHTGAYFDLRGYTTSNSKAGLDWDSLRKDVAKYGVRNGYIMAIAPNATTSIIAGSTASTDPIYQVVTYEEKSSYKVANPAPDLNITTAKYYKPAVAYDQHKSIAMAAVRQRHIDQAQSFNFYVTPNIKAKELLDLHMDAWKSGLKTTYYIRSRSLTVEECEWCAS